MGVIQRQSIKNSLVNYLGVLIGALSTIFIYPLDLELYGTIQTWMAGAILLIPILTLGSHSLVQKFYPYFKQNKISGFLKLILISSILIILITSLILYLIKSIILDNAWLSHSQTNLYTNSIHIVYTISILMIFAGIFRSQAGNHNRIVIPDLVEKLGFKIIIPIIVLAYFWNYISITQVKFIVVGFYIFVVAFFVLYLIKLKAFDVKGKVFSHISFSKTIEMLQYSIFNVLNQIGYQLASQIDKIMLSGLITTTATGKYSIFLFLAAILEIPTRAIYQISSPLISSAFENNNINYIQSLYKKTSINLTVIGVGIFSIIWLNIENLFQIMSNGNDMRPYKYLFLYLGIAKISDMVTSINGYIIIFSKYYKYNLVFIGIMAISNIVSNFIFIKTYGIIGAGIATALSMILYNIIKSVYIYIKLGIHPLSNKTLTILSVLLVVVLLSKYILLRYNPVINTIIISSFFTTIYLTIIVKFNLSPDIVKVLTKKIRN